MITYTLKSEAQYVVLSSLTGVFAFICVIAIILLLTGSIEFLKHINIYVQIGMFSIFALIATLISSRFAAYSILTVEQDILIRSYNRANKQDIPSTRAKMLDAFYVSHADWVRENKDLISSLEVDKIL